MSAEEIQVRENVPLAPLTTLGVGGPARFFVTAVRTREVERAVAFARTRKLPLFVLGGGSNIVIADHGFDGLVLQIGIGGIDSITGESKAVFEVGAGVNWDKFVAFAVSRGYGGIECLGGIPGTVGATPVQNVGAYGQEVSQTIVSVLAYDLVQNVVHEFKKPECGFAYRSSIFNTSQQGRYIILRVTYELCANAEPRLVYADLQKHFASYPGKPTLSEVRNAVLKIRAAKGMVIDPNDPDTRSVGSFFKNPVLSPEEYAQLQSKAAQRRLRLPSYPALAQHNKVPAAWLVENSGFSKGYRKGNASISRKHALALVNCGGVTAAEIISLKNAIQDQVQQSWGLRLQPEPVFVGF